MRNRNFLLKLSLSVLITALLVRYVNLHETYAILRKVQIHYLAIVFLIINADRVFMAYKWKILLKAKGLDSPLSPLIRGYYLSSFLAPVLPSSFGDDVVRGVSVTKTGIGSDNIFSSIVIERILGMLSLFLLALLTLGFFVRGEYRYFEHILIYVALFCALSFAAFLYSLEKKISIGNIHNRLSGSSSKIASFLSKMYLSYMDYRNYKKHLLAFFFLSMIEHLVIVYMNYLIIKGLGFQVTLVSMVYTIPTIMFLSRLPISVGQIGVQEGAYVMLLSLVGLSLTDSVTISVVKRAVILVSVLPGFLLTLASRRGKGLGPLSPVEEKSPELR
jgi:glycosyltransferase 2 family protein